MHGSPAAFGFILAVLTAFWLLGALGAWFIGMLTPGQMLRTRGTSHGIPFLGHFGMLDDLIIHPVLALNVGLFWPTWNSADMAMLNYVAWLMAAVAAYGLNQAWAKMTAKTGTREAQAHEGVLTGVGWIHVPHTAVILWAMIMMLVSLLFGYMHPLLAFADVSLIAAHVIMGTHWPLKVMNPVWNPFGPARRQDAWLGAACVTLQSVGLSFLAAYALLA